MKRLMRNSLYPRNVCRESTRGVVLSDYAGAPGWGLSLLLRPSLRRGGTITAPETMLRPRRCEIARLPRAGVPSMTTTATTRAFTRAPARDRRRSARQRRRRGTTRAASMCGCSASVTTTASATFARRRGRAPRRGTTPSTPPSTPARRSFGRPRGQGQCPLRRGLFVFAAAPRRRGTDNAIRCAEAEAECAAGRQILVV